MTNNYESIDELLQRENSSVKPVKKYKLIKEKKRLILVVIAGSIAFSGIVIGCSKNKNNNKKTTNINVDSSVSTMSIDDMGIELETTKDTTSKYIESTGKVDTNKIVEKNNKVYVDQESADKSNKVGKTTIDTKNDTLEINSEGTVIEKETGYEIVDENNNVVASGNNEETLLEGYITLDRDYYYKDGTLAFPKGSIVNEEEFNRYKGYLVTNSYNAGNQQNNNTYPSTNQNQYPEQYPEQYPNSNYNTNITYDEGIINMDGTYTIYGMTFESKADYQQWVFQGYQGYSEVNGIMMSDQKIQSQYQYIK